MIFRFFKGVHQLLIAFLNQCTFSFTINVQLNKIIKLIIDFAIFKQTTSYVELDIVSLHLEFLK